MATLKDLISPLTTEAVKGSIYSVVTGLGLNPSEWKPGDPEAAIVWSVSTKVAELWNVYGTPAIASGFLDYASGLWLRQRAKQGYGVDYIPAQFASGEWTGTNGGVSTLGPYAAGDLVFVHSVSGKTYRNTSTVSFLSGVPLIIPIQATEVGTGSDAAPGTIVLQTVILNLSGTNTASVLGVDDEEDVDLKARCRLRLGALSPNGAASAYEFVARTPVDPAGRWDHGVTVTQVNVSANSSTGNVTVYLAGSEGELTGDEVDAVDEAIQTTVVPEAITATVLSADGVTVPVTYILYVSTSSGLTSGEIQALVADALADLFRESKIGGTVLTTSPGHLFRNVIESAILRAVPGSLQVTLSAPAADVALDENEVAVLGTITSTVTLVVT